MLKESSLSNAHRARLSSSTSKALTNSCGFPHPSREIYSRGPKRYEFKEGYWANLTDGHSLLDLITDELNSKFKPNEPINLREPEGSLSNI
mmetsp:Transcript_10644/g.20614  ORF Transcript_10644/g.20614 Transcript_10644/m.20614 type:complete len:91 (+) Transcript_10644:4691-4963(+)